MDERKVEMADKIQILTRAICIVQVARKDRATGVVYKSVSSLEDVLATYKKLHAALTEEPSE